MGRPGGALRYAELEPAHSTLDEARPERAGGDVVDARFERARTEQQSMADDDGDGEQPENAARRPGRPRGDSGDGSKSLARIEERMARRSERTALRDALDLIRQQELLENMEQRRARMRQRRWYVLGRAIEALMDEGGPLKDELMNALDRRLERRDERQLLGLAPLRTQPE